MERRQAARAAVADAATRRGHDRRRLRARGPALILYLDTSAIVKLVIEEEGSEEARSALAEAPVALTTRLTYVELQAALARMKAGRRITSAEERAKLDAFGRLWSQAGVVDIDRGVIEQGAHLARKHSLRAYDAVHLASAAVAASAEPIQFACWDGELRAAASNEGHALLPPRDAQAALPRVPPTPGFTL